MTVYFVVRFAGGENNFGRSIMFGNNEKGSKLPERVLNQCTHSTTLVEDIIRIFGKDKYLELSLDQMIIRLYNECNREVKRQVLTTTLHRAVKDSTCPIRRIRQGVYCLSWGENSSDILSNYRYRPNSHVE